MATEKLLTAAEFLADPNTVKLKDDDPDGDPEDIFHLLMGKGFLYRDLLIVGEFEVLAARLARDYPNRFKRFIDYQMNHMVWFSTLSAWQQRSSAITEGQNAYPKELKPYFETHEGFSELESYFNFI